MIKSSYESLLMQNLLKEEPRFFLDDGPQATQDIYRLPNALIKIAQTIEEENKEQFIRSLEEHRTQEILRKHSPPVHLDFTQVINYIKDKKSAEVACNAVDPDKGEELEEAAEAMDMLSYEGFGLTLGYRTYKEILQSSESLCIVARDKTTNKIIGFALGSLVKLSTDRPAEDIKVFHIWACVRSASYPGVQFIKNLETIKDTALQKLNPDVVTLGVNGANPSLRTRYEKAGFQVEGAGGYNQFTQTQGQFMVYRVSKNLSTVDRAALKTALWQQGFGMLGWKGPFLAVGFLVRRVYHWWAY